jgi:serine/threonine protein kinase
VGLIETEVLGGAHLRTILAQRLASRSAGAEVRVMPDANLASDSTVANNPVVRFRMAWETGQRPDLDQYLRALAPAEWQLLPALVHIDLECRLQAGENVRVEDYLGRYPTLANAEDGVASLVAVECLHRVRQAIGSLQAEYLHRFPNCEAALRQRWSAAPGCASEAGAGPGVPPAVLRYRPERFHAQGGLGEVWLAHDLELNREVALKRLQARYCGDADNHRRFLREAEVTGRLEHPGVVPVYGLHQGEDGQACYAMRFIRGETLQDAIRHFHEADRPGRDPGERSVAFRQLLGRFVAVCNTVAYAHSRGVLHRDIKPANIMLGNYGETLVVDWGLAKSFERDEVARASGENTLAPSGPGGEGSTQAGAVLGTPAYMSPEQASGRLEQVGVASDVFALGATLYALLTGQAPYSGIDAVVQAAVGEVVPARQRKRSVPAALEAVCRKAMAVKSEDRYGSALELAAEIERWLADEPVQARRESVREKLQRGFRSQPILAALFVLFGVADLSLLASLVISIIWLGGPDPRMLVSPVLLGFFALVAVLLMQVTAALGGLIGSAVGLLGRVIGGARSVRLGSWVLFGARTGLLAGVPLGALALWGCFAISPADSSSQEKVLVQAASGVGVAGPLLGALFGVVLALRRGRWLRALATGAFAGSLIGLAAACPLLLAAFITQDMKKQDTTELEPTLTYMIFSSDGQRVVSGSSNGQVAVWDGVTGEPLWKVQGHSGSVLDVMFSADDQRIASAGDDGLLGIWDARSGQLSFLLDSQGQLRGLYFSPDGKRLAGVSEDGWLRVWDVQSGQEVRSLRAQSGGVSIVAFSPDGKRVATFGPGGLRVVSGFWER